MKIFLVAGKAGSGKAEVAKMIKEYFIYQKKDAVITEYSKYLKEYAKEMTNWDGYEANKPRKFLQDLGTYIRKDLNMPNFFTERMLEDIKVYERDFEAVVICDVRYPNEIKDIKNVYDDVTSIFVVNQFGMSNLTVEEQIHSSELALDSYDEFDYTIINNNLDDVKKEVFSILEKGSK